VKEINLDDSIYSIIQTYPELKDVLYDLGFTDIIKPIMLSTVGKIMDLNKGSKMKNISIDKIVSKLKIEGFTIKGE